MAKKKAKVPKKLTCSLSISEKDIKEAIDDGAIDPLLNRWVLDARALMLTEIEKYVK